MTHTLTFVEFVLASFAAWRITHLLVVEDGPWDVFEAIRKAARLAGLERLSACFYCASVWVALAMVLLFTRDWRELVILVPAISGAAILLERATDRGTAATTWIEEEETK